MGHAAGAPTPRASDSITVGEPGRRSTIWRVWANPKKGDIYIASRKTAWNFKLSLHESGDWRCRTCGGSLDLAEW
jgi:hypothetical protein